MSSALLKRKLIGNRQNLFLFFLFILGAGLRIFQLGVESLWYDEVGTIDQATRDLTALFSEFYQDPPLYPFLLRYWMLALGPSEISLRLLSVVFSVASLFLLYSISSSLFNRKIGYISTFLLSVSPFHIFYSQEVRYYSLSLFLVLASIFLFQKVLRRDKNACHICLCIVNVFLLLSNAISVVIILIEIIFYYKKKGSAKEMASKSTHYVCYILCLDCVGPVQYLQGSNFL